MSLKNRFRRLPPVCALVALLRILTGRLRFENRYVGRVFVMQDGQRFRAFRHMSQRAGKAGAQVSPAILVVRFKFAKFSQGLNRVLSLIPVPLIGGYPGFRDKLWMVDEDSGDWQGVYEWESTAAVKAYQCSFALRVMNRRAVPESISYAVIERTLLADYLTRRAEPSVPTANRDEGPVAR
jgi:hypothetical protein